MSKLQKFFCSLLVIASIVLRLSAHSVEATIGYCQVSSISPTNISPNSTGSLSFDVHNGGFGSVVWVKITSPSANFTINSGTSSGWSASVSDSSVTFTGGTQGNATLVDYEVAVSTGAETPQASWTVQVSDSADGSDPTTCAGETRVAISDSSVDTDGPSLTSDVTVEVVSDTSVKMTWTTDEIATSVVNYGTADADGATASETTAGTNHSVTISSLSANTTYHFSIDSTDIWGNSSSTEDNTFTISKGPVTVRTTTTTVTNTTTVTKLVEDTTLPAVKITSNLSEVYKIAPEIFGTATDNSGVSLVEYSIDDGKNWSTAFLNSKIGSKTTGFSFTPDISEDGNYKIVVRATDTSGNVSTSKASELVFDRLPPLIGGNIWSIGPIPLAADSGGIITTLAGVDYKITMSAVGGPTSVDLAAGDKSFSMGKSADSGLWRGMVNFTLPGFYVISVKAVDGAGNVTERALNPVVVIGSGKVREKETGRPLTGSEVAVYQKDNLSKIWSLWDGASFNQKNPQMTSGDGSYSYFLPSGTYYLKVSAPGRRTVTSNIFRLDSPGGINANIEMKPASVIQIGPFSITLPDFSFETVDISVSTPNMDSIGVNKNTLIGAEAPDINLPMVSGHDLSLLSKRGESQAVIFLNTWLPEASSQISQVMALGETYKNRISFIISQESLSKSAVFAKRGGYDDLTIAADPDGTLVASYKINSLPASYFIDRKGIIQNVIYGTVSGSDIIKYLNNY